jgi:pyruvate formate lyase activating enzyme
LADLLPYLDAANVDLKSFSDEIYQRVSGGYLQPVLDTILAMKETGVWVEITNLVIPGVNDDMEMIRRMCQWLVAHDLSDAPLHFSRFFPRYKMQDSPPTSISTLRKAKQIAEEEGIRNVYLGNV